jgi:hypothetical protein
MSAAMMTAQWRWRGWLAHFRTLWMQSEGYTTCENALKFSLMQSVGHVLDQHFTRPQEEQEVWEHKTRFLYALKGRGSQKVHVLIWYQELYFCNVQQRWKWIIQSESWRKKAQDLLTGWRNSVTRYEYVPYLSVIPGLSWDSALIYATTSSVHFLSIHRF